MSNTPATLAAKLAAVGTQLDRIQKDGEITGNGGYRYASTDAIADALRPKLADAGIVIMPNSVELIRHERIETERSGSRGNYVQIQWLSLVHVRWIVTDGNESLAVESLGENLNSSDKGVNAATTIARKNMLLSLFNLSTGEDPDATRPEVTRDTASRPAPVPHNGNGGSVSGSITYTADGFVVRFNGDGDAWDRLRVQVRSVRGCKWDNDAKVWRAPHEARDELVDIGREFGLQMLSEEVAA
jgi:ERF superfamily